jgi:hypothetical protein
MNNDQDKVHLQELIEQVKQAKVKENIEIYSDEEIVSEITQKLINKEGRYFLKTFGIDDHDIDNEEFTLLQWIMYDLFKVENESEYRQRIEAMLS